MHMENSIKKRSGSDLEEYNKQENAWSKKRNQNGPKTENNLFVFKNCMFQDLFRAYFWKRLVFVSLRL